MTSTSKHITAPSRNSGTVCIVLLIVAIALQLYLISLWLTPRTPIEVLQAAPAKCGPTAAEKIEMSKQMTLKDTSEALDAIQMLNKFIRQRRNKIDLLDAGGEVVAKEDAHDAHAHKKQHKQKKKDVMQHGGHEHTHEHLLDATQEEINVDAKGLVLAAHSEDEPGHSEEAHRHAEEHHAGDNHSEEFLQKFPDLYHSVWLNISSRWADDVLHPDRYHKLSSEDKARHDQCMEWFREHKVKVDAGWGTLPQHLHSKFDELRCSDVISLDVTARFIQSHSDLYDRVWPVPADRQKVKAEPGMENNVIATIVCITTRSLTINNAFNDLALFKDLLPSFVRTVEEGFEYWFYLGYDKGDPWLDDPDHLNQVRGWFDTHVADTLRKRNIVAKLVLSTWENPYRKPGPAFNHVTGVAYADGATWIYRINDDQTFDTPWARAFVDTLLGMGPPYGVVGPACGQGATHILVVDFVHRTHHEIFPTHYPPALMAWWMDNWVSQVYGRKRTVRVTSAKITHLTGSHGTRYDGFYDIGQFMRGEILRGRAMFEEYLSHTPGMKAQLDTYRADSFSYTT